MRDSYDAYLDRAMEEHFFGREEPDEEDGPEEPDDLHEGCGPAHEGCLDRSPIPWRGAGGELA